MIDDTKNLVDALLGKFHDLQPAMNKAELSADFEALDKPLGALLLEAKATLLELESGRGALAFSGEDSGALDGQIGQVKSLIKDLEGSLAVAQKRRDSAAEQELQDECTKRQSDAAKAFKRIAELNSDYVKAATQVADVLSDLAAEETRFRAANTFLRDHNRSDMQFVGFYSVLATKTGYPADVPSAGVLLPGIWPKNPAAELKRAKIINKLSGNQQAKIEPITKAELKAEVAAKPKAA